MIKNYFKIAARNFSRHKLYAAINISGLAFGLAAFWMIALYIADEFSYDRYNVNADRICRVVQHARWAENDVHEATTSFPFAPALKAAFPEVKEATRILAEGGGIISYNANTLKVNDIFFADNNIFNVFTIPFLAGDPATALIVPQAIVIDESLAVKLFGDPQKAINQTVYFENNFPNTVTGVIKDLPVNAHFHFSALRSLPAGFTSGWQNFNVYTYLLLNEGTSLKSFRARLPQFTAKTIQPLIKVDDYQIELQPLPSIHLFSNLQYEIAANGSISRIYMFIAIATLILVIAIINYINLSTARSSSRIKEVSVHKVIGSSRWQLNAMFLSESILITALAAFFAVIIIQAALPLFNQLIEKHLSFWRFGKGTTLLLLTGFTLLTGVISGIYPAVFLSRFKTVPALKGQMGDLSSNLFFRRSLVVFQFVITIIMISGSLVVYLQLKYASHKYLGFNKEQVLSFHINDRELRKHTDALKIQLLKNPAIEAVAVCGNPIGNNDLGGLGYTFETAKGNFSTSSTMAQELMVDPDFIPAMEIKMLAGRNFSDAVRSDQYGAALINETLLKKIGWTNPAGKKIKFPIDDKGNTAERTVIGIVKDFHTYSLQHKVEPLVMVMPPDPSAGDNLYIKVAKGKAREGLAYMEKTYHDFDKANPLDYHFLDANFAMQYRSEEKQGQIALVFTVLAVLIACLGLFGLTTFTSEQRKKEIGIRKVLGAGIAGIVGMLSAEFLKLVLVAACIALPVAWLAMNKWLQDFAYRISVNWWILVAAAILAFAIAVLTVSFQAVKAAMVNPVKSLRTE